VEARRDDEPAPAISVVLAVSLSRTVPVPTTTSSSKEPATSLSFSATFGVSAVISTAVTPPSRSASVISISWSASTPAQHRDDAAVDEP